MQQHVEAPRQNWPGVPERNAGTPGQAARHLDLAGIGEGTQPVQKDDADRLRAVGICASIPCSVRSTVVPTAIRQVAHDSMPKWALASSLIISGDHGGS